MESITEQIKAKIFPVMEDTASVTGLFAWRLNPESVNISFGRILSPDVSVSKSELNTLEN